MDSAGMTLKKAIDDKAKEIIETVRDFADADNTRLAIISNMREGKRQFTDLVEAAAQSCCIEEFKLYIKYKASKEGTKKFWGKLADPFNEKVDILIERVANEIISDNHKKDNENKLNAEDETIRLEVLRRFCGYLMWREHSDIAFRQKEADKR